MFGTFLFRCTRHWIFDLLVFNPYTSSHLIQMFNRTIKKVITGSKDKRQHPKIHLLLLNVER